MKSCQKFTKLFTALLIGLFFIGFSLTTLDTIFEQVWKTKDVTCLLGDPEIISKPSATIYMFENQISADPLALFFQIAFILFLISPPIIAFLLFLIWKELKKRNELK